MKKHILYYNRLVKKYNKYKCKLGKAESSPYHYSRKDVLVKRIKELFKRIQEFKRAFRVTVASGAMAFSMLLTTNDASAQQLTLETSTQAGLAHAENYSSPTFVDVNGDGNLDLVIGERYGTTQGGLFVFINENGSFVRISESNALSNITLQIDSVHNIPDFDGGGGYFGPDFADYDGDEDEDLFVGQTDGDGSSQVSYDRIRFFENEGGTYTEKFGSDNPLSAFSDGDFTKPTFVDLNGDGDLDVVIGKGNGEIVYWENDGQGNFAAAAENPFSGFFSGDGSEEGSEIAFADIDGDGDLDGIVGHKDGLITYLENTGTAETPTFEAVDGGENPFDGLTFDQGDRISPEFADLDADGDLDLFVGTINGPIQFFENDGGVFTLHPENDLGLPDIGNNAVPDMVDWDEDGDMDAVVSTGSMLRYFENSDGLFAELAGDDNPLAFVNSFASDTSMNSISPEFVDWNGDGYKDLFLGNGDQDSSPIFYFENDQNGNLVAQTSPFGDYAGVRDAIAFLDWDNDGDLDSFVGNKNGNILYFENNGDGTLTQNDETNPFADDSFGENAQPEFYDWDRDGDLDAFIGKGEGKIQYWENTGTDFVQNDEANPFDKIKFVNNSSLSFGDVNNDGVQDAIVGDRTGKLWYFSNEGTAEGPAVDNELEAQYAVEGKEFSLSVEGIFSDVNADIKLYRAKHSDGTPLPAWLSFDRVAGLFSGSPSEANLGSLELMVEAVDADNNIAEISFTLYVTTVSGIEDNADFSVYPNPSSDLLTIRDLSRSAKSIQILDLNGSVVRLLNNSNDLTEINISDLKSGLYVLRIISDGNAIVTKFIKE